MVDVPWGNCPQCVKHEIAGGITLGMAIATCAISNGVESPDMATMYFAEYHERGHEDQH